MSRPSEPVGRRALVLGGGGLLAAMYEIGCLAALARAGALPTFDLYVGTSGGSVVAALLAAGYRPVELLRLIGSFSPDKLCRLDVGAFVRASSRLAFQAVRQLASGRFHRTSAVFGLLALLQEVMPTGLLSIEPLAAFVRGLIRERGRSDDFASLPHRLYVPAIDLDTGERVVFGEPAQLGTDVSTAVAASCAIPRFFRPVSSGGRDLIDGGIADAVNLDVALGEGAVEALVVNPLVAPLNDRQTRCLPSPRGGCGHVADQGLVVALGQAIRISHMIHTSMSFRLCRITHPEAQVEIIQPDRLEAVLNNPMDFRERESFLNQGTLDGQRAASRIRSRGWQDPPPHGDSAASPASGEALPAGGSRRAARGG